MSEWSAAHVQTNIWFTVEAAQFSVARRDHSCRTRPDTAWRLYGHEATASDSAAAGCVFVRAAHAAGKDGITYEDMVAKAVGNPARRVARRGDLLQVAGAEGQGLDGSPYSSW